MPISVSEAVKIFPSKLGGVRIIYVNTEASYMTIPRTGKYVIVQLSSGRLFDGDGGRILARASFYDIVAYNGTRQYYSTSLRMTRWYSGKARWCINRQLAAKIRRAVHYVR